MVQSIPTYAMSCFESSIFLCNEIEIMIGKPFLRGSVERDRRHGLSWKNYPNCGSLEASIGHKSSFVWTSM